MAAHRTKIPAFDRQPELTAFVTKIDTLIAVSKTAKRGKISLKSHQFYAPKARIALAELKQAEGALSAAYSSVESVSVTEHLQKIITDLSVAYGQFPNYREYLPLLDEARLVATTELKVALESVEMTPKKKVVLQKEYITEEILKDHEAVPKQILHEINVSYEYECFNGAAVLIRRLVESLIILAFDVHGIGGQIKDGSGNYVGLESLIGRAQQSPDLNLTRNAKNGLPTPKFYGDLAAHNPRARVRKGDLDSAQPDLRVVIEELGALSSPTKRAELQTKKRAP